MMNSNPYTEATFLKSAARVNQLPEDTGIEVAFAGRSNAGKSTAINILTANHRLARTSKTPGRTQLINLFTLADPQKRIVDLPGYGYAKVSHAVKEEWQKNLADYFESRRCLRGLVLVMDIRHPLKPQDTTMINWCLTRQLPVHILLNKADKISRGLATTTQLHIQRVYQLAPDLISVQPFSGLKKTGLETLITRLNEWYEMNGTA